MKFIEILEIGKISICQYVNMPSTLCLFLNKVDSF